MKALITGASSGIGMEIASVLSQKGYDIIAVARREDKLIKLKNSLDTNVEIMCLDVTKDDDILKIASKLNEVDIFINNAGFGVFGKFSQTELSKELKMLDTNVKAVHILTKYAVKSFKEKGFGYIMNVASVAAFFPGPMFSSYYAGKSYVFRLTEAIYEEIRREKSKVKISVLCPGPVKTEFENIAGVAFETKDDKDESLIVADKRKVAEYAVDKMLKGKLIIVPGKIMKLGVLFRRFVSEKTLCKVMYFFQNKKNVKDEI